MSTRTRIVPARGIPPGVIVCSYSTRKALIAAGVQTLDIVVPQAMIELENGLMVPIDRGHLTDSQICDALASAVNGIGR